MPGFDAGTFSDTDTTGAQLLNSTERVLTITFQTRTANTGKCYVGLSDVTDTYGWELDSGKNELAIDLKGLSQAISTFYVAKTDTGDLLDFRVVYQ